MEEYMSEQKNKKRVIVIDALNMFLRAYIVDPSLSTNGQPIGGIKGTFKILQKLTRITKPDAVVICWDGPNGSRKRKSMDKNYKAGRKPIRLNRAFHNLTDNEELQNRIWQQTRVIEYFNEMPIMQVMIPEIEADDVIAYICGMQHYEDWQKVIISNDKDFLQLCDENTVLYRPTVDELMNKNRVVEKYGIHPTNMALARAIVGDTSDNLKGIKGAGLTSVKKRLSFLASEKDYTIDDVLQFCENADSKIKFFSNIVEGKKIISHNYKMMQLYSPQLSLQSKKFVDNAIENFESNFNYIEIIKKMRVDGFGELNWEELKTHLNKIQVDC
jgi:DNA polymerase-1